MDVQEKSDLAALFSLSLHAANISLQPEATLVEISFEKSLHINLELEGQQTKKLIELLQKQSRAFAWDYNDMKGIHLDTYSHHIYT